MINVQDYKTRYLQVKKILEIVMDADSQDPRAKILRKSLTVDDVIRMNQFIAQCTDEGLQLTTHERSN